MRSRLIGMQIDTQICAMTATAKAGLERVGIATALQIRTSSTSFVHLIQFAMEIVVSGLSFGTRIVIQLIAHFNEPAVKLHLRTAK